MMLVPRALHDQKGHIAPNFNFLNLGNAMVPLMMLALAQMASHHQESHVVPHFNYLDLRDAIMALMMLLALCYAGANGFT